MAVDGAEERAIRAEGEKVKRAGRTAFCELPWAARVQKLVEGTRLLKLSPTTLRSSLHSTETGVSTSV